MRVGQAKKGCRLPQAFGVLPYASIRMTVRMAGGAGNPLPFVVAEEPKVGTPYEIPVSKNIEQGTFTDANGNFSLEVNPGVPVKVAASAPAYAFNLSDLTPAEDGSTATLNLTGCAKSQQEVAVTLVRLRQMNGASDVSLKQSSATKSDGGSSGGASGCMHR